MDVSTSLVVSYSIFSFFLFYQQLHVKNYRGQSEVFNWALLASAFTGMVFNYGFLIWWGYTISWLGAALLFAIAFAIKLPWFTIEAKLGLREHYWVLSLLGFAGLPASGYAMLASVP